MQVQDRCIVRSPAPVQECLNVVVLPNGDPGGRSNWPTPEVDIADFACHAPALGSVTFTEVQEVPVCKAFHSRAFIADHVSSEYLLTETLTFSIFIAGESSDRNNTKSRRESGELAVRELNSPNLSMPFCILVNVDALRSTLGIVGR